MRKSRMVTRSMAERRRINKDTKKYRIKNFKNQLEGITNNFVKKMNSVISDPFSLALTSIYEWEAKNADYLFHIRKNQTFLADKRSFKMIYATTKFILELDIETYYGSLDNSTYDCECEILNSCLNEVDKDKVKQLVKDNVMIVYGAKMCIVVDKKYNFDIEWFE